MLLSSSSSSSSPSSHADTSAILRAQQSMWPGSYDVMVQVTDQQGLGCPEPQKVTVEVCTCDAGGTCSMRGAHGKVDKGAELGAAAIGLMLLGALMLLREYTEQCQPGFCDQGVYVTKDYIRLYIVETSPVHILIFCVFSVN